MNVTKYAIDSAAATTGLKFHPPIVQKLSVKAKQRQAVTRLYTIQGPWQQKRGKTFSIPSNFITVLTIRNRFLMNN